jgi:hypothetical protein
MKRTYSLLLVGVLALAPLARATDRVVTTETPTGAGSLTAAINALLDGDRITFNIPPGAGEVHWIQVPLNGFPLITKNNVTIDGYTQPGATSNTASIHAANNAALKIVLSATNGNALSMYSAVTNAAGRNYPNLGFGDGEQAVLGFFKATNAWTKGIVFVGVPTTSTTHAANGDCKLICFAPDAPDISSNACQNFHVSGCWFGVDPVTKQAEITTDGFSTVACGAISIATYTTGTNGTVPGYTNSTTAAASAIIGVAPGSAAPRAEFNVFVTVYGFDSQGGPFRVSGNFWNVLPDGVTLADMSVLGFGQQSGDAFLEFGDGGPGFDILVGTDGDGVNDADEGNVFGDWSVAGQLTSVIYYYGAQGNTVIAGNTFGVDVTGKSFGVGTNTKLLHHLATDATCQVRFGSDFNGVSDALEGNTVADYQLFDYDAGSKTNSHWLSMRGNSLTNTFDTSGSSSPANRPPVGDGQTSSDGMDLYTNFIDVSIGAGGIPAIIPVIGPTTTTTSLSGVCGKPLAAPYTNLVVDLYQADPNPADPPQGIKWLGSFTDNSAADSNSAVGAFTFDTTSLSIAHGTKVTITVTYVSETRPTIASVARAGSQTTVKISNPGSTTFGIQKSAAVSPTSWSSTGAAAVGGTATFTDSGNPKSFYRAQGPTALGQTSPFSNVFSVP